MIERNSHVNGLAAGLAGGILGNLAGGIGGDAFLRKTGIGRPMFVFWVMLIMMPFMLVRLFVEPGTFFFEGCIFLGYFLLGCFYGPTFATVQDLVPLLKSVRLSSPSTF